MSLMCVPMDRSLSRARKSRKADCCCFVFLRLEYKDKYKEGDFRSQAGWGKEYMFPFYQMLVRGIRRLGRVVLDTNQECLEGKVNSAEGCWEMLDPV